MHERVKERKKEIKRKRKEKKRLTLDDVSRVTAGSMDGILCSDLYRGRQAALQNQ